MWLVTSEVQEDADVNGGVVANAMTPVYMRLWS